MVDDGETFVEADEVTEGDKAELAALLATMVDGEYSILEGLQGESRPGDDDRPSAFRSPSSSKLFGAAKAVMAVVSMKKDADTQLCVEEAGSTVHDEAQLTNEMMQVRQAALESYAEKAGMPATDRQRAFLTSTTLRHYVNPAKVKHLTNTLLRREKCTQLLRGDVNLVGSLRVVGWDGDGSTILSWETATQRATFKEYLPQFEYCFWTALDLNRPTASGIILISSYTNGYFNPLYFLNPSPLLALAEMLEGQYRRRLKAAIIIGMPRAFNWLLKLLLKAVKEETRSKLVMCDTEEEALQRLSAMHNVDEPTLRRLQASLDNRLQHRRSPKRCGLRWSPLVEHPFFEQALAELKLDAQTERITPKIHAGLRRAIHEFRVQHWGTYTQRIPSTASQLTDRLSDTPTETASPQQTNIGRTTGHLDASSTPRDPEAAAADALILPKQALTAGLLSYVQQKRAGQGGPGR